MRAILGATAVWVLTSAWSPEARAGATIVNPYAPTRAPVHLDLSHGKIAPTRHDSKVRFSDLDQYKGRPVVRHAQGTLPEGWVQQGDVVVPKAVAEGAEVRMPALDEITSPGRPSYDMVMGPGAAEICTFPDATPPGIYPGKFIRGNEYPRHGTVYMNYTGGVLFAGGENSAENRSTLAKSGHEYPVYGGGETKAIAVAQAVQNDFAKVAVRVVYEQRPPKMLPYVMIMMGGDYTDTTAGPSGGVAPGSDCEDAGLRNVCYAFVNGGLAVSQANVASQEIGHTMGLGHTYGDDRVMAYGYDTNALTDMGFGEVCSDVLVAQGQGGYCSGVNKCHCGGEGDQQHDLRTLQAIYAPAGPDMVPPTIEITSPDDGAVYALDATVPVAFLPQDDFGGYGWMVSIYGADDELLAELVDYEATQSLALSGLPAGKITLVARVQDHADQVGEDTVVIYIGEEPAPGTTGGEESTGGESGETGVPGSTGGDEPTSAPTSEGEASSAGGESSGGASETTPETGDDGCNCRATGGAPGLGLLVALGLRRRRRTREPS